MKKIVVICVMTLLIMATNTIADWDPGDGHKMHFPQLPDEDGWDVRYGWPIVLADDWKCSKSGPVEDIHFWGSIENDTGDDVVLWGNFIIDIWSDLPAEESPTGYSMPNEQLWNRTLATTKVRPLVTEDWEGWYDPPTGYFHEEDHKKYYQFNIENISDPFYQEEGNIYWLSITTPPPAYVPEYYSGWKSSENYWNDNAVWATYGAWDWKELYEPPYFEHKLDLSFVITGGETVSPNITIIHPRDAIYLWGIRLFVFPSLPPGVHFSIVLGPITIETDVVGSGINSVDFSIDDIVTGPVIRNTATNPPYEWAWNDPTGIYVVGVQAKDISGNLVASDFVFVLKLF